jgi:hypothetical protein
MPPLVKLAALGSIVLIGLSAIPGKLDDIFFIGIVLCPLSFIGLCSVLLLMIVRHGRSAKHEAEVGPMAGEDIGLKKRTPRLRGIVISSALSILCFVLIRTGIPRRAAFQISRPMFERHLATAPASEYDGKPLGRFVGVYYVDRYAADPRGGVYFRTHEGADGIGPDTTSYGFAFRPNRQGTPFGRARYTWSRIADDWYVFSASNDY